MLWEEISKIYIPNIIQNMKHNFAYILIYGITERSNFLLLPVFTDKTKRPFWYCYSGHLFLLKAKDNFIQRGLGLQISSNLKRLNFHVKHKSVIFAFKQKSIFLHTLCFSYSFT